MKKTLIAMFSVAAIATLLFSGCKKTDSDTTAPAVYLEGSNPMYIIKGNTAVDPGATATDDVDGTITPTSNWGASNPNITTAGSYTITYIGKDAAGNSTTTTRTVYVVDIAGVYVNAKDTCATSPSSTFDATVVTSGTSGGFAISNFGAFGTSVSVNCKLESSGNITVTNNQSLGGGATINNVFNSSSKMISASGPLKFVIKYGWTDGTISDVCTSTYTK